MFINKNTLLEKLKGPLPGADAQNLMAPETRGLPQTRENCKTAAVLVMIYPGTTGHRLVFIKRNEYEGHHSGQISFPGGMHETNDLSLSQTALREAHEETGAPLNQIELLGSLSPLHIPVSNICVHPFIGWLDTEPIFHPDPGEVQYLVCPTLEELKTPENIRHSRIIRGEMSFHYPYYHVEGEQIWGATAMMLSEFMELLDY